ncbi:MAG: glycosyltransferase family 39 protein [Cyanobacteria bacterium SBLK]|nr:glycosyltransferase family 39 protein [Cyanobacteria bacterium SBLK]
MPRVMHWVQNQSVSHYPTNFLPQLYYTPWSEYAILNFQILSNSDRFANLVQWLAMLGCCVGISSIAKQLGANSLGQIFSVIFTIAIPMGILQASSTKNDYTVAFWLVCLVYFIVSAISSQQYLKTSLIIGLSLGLAVFTKPTAYPYAFPFCLWFLYQIFSKNRKSFLSCFVCMAIPALLINLGLFWRNFLLFGKPIFSHADYQTEITNLNLLTSNIIKNLSLHLPIPLIPHYNQFIEKSIIEIHKSILNIDINDPRITASNVSFGLPKIFNFESNAPNSLHFYLIILAIAIFILAYRKYRHSQLTQYLLALIFSFLLFCYLAKWQPWQSRLHLSLFILFSPFVSIVFNRIFNQRVIVYLALFLMGYSSFWVLCNESRPILIPNNIFNTPRLEQYFNTRFDLKADYSQAVQLLKQQKCYNVGLILQGDYWEYPFWILLRSQSKLPIHIQHIHVNNISATTRSNVNHHSITPCALLMIDREIEPFQVTPFGIYQQTTQPLPLSFSGSLQIYQHKN